MHRWNSCSQACFAEETDLEGRAMADETNKPDAASDGADFSKLPKFPGAIEGWSDDTPPEPRRRRHRWLGLGAVLGAAFGLVFAIPDLVPLLPRIVRRPADLVGQVFIVIGAAQWVIDWIGPMIGYGLLGFLAGW